MDSNSPKRRKLGHVNGGPVFEGLASSSMGASGSSAFVLETEELLKESRIEHASASQGPDHILRRLKDAIEGLDAYGPVPIQEASSSWERANGVRIPFPDPKPAKECPYKVAFEKPTHVNVVGSYASQTMVRSQPDFGIDMIVAMPRTLFTEKDYRDFRYFYKRAFFLAYIAGALRRQFADMDFSYAALNGNPLTPVLLAQPRERAEGDLHYEIRIIPSAPEDYFPAARLSATSCAIRPRHPGGLDENNPATPYYNSTLRSESLFVAYLKILHRAASTCASFKDACMLGRIWLQQRGFGSDKADGGFGHFHWAVLMALLLQSGGRKGEPVLSPSLHSSQLFQATIQYLASANMHKKAAIIGSNDITPEAYRQAGPVLYDSARSINLLFNMAPWSANLLVEQAKLSLSAINDPSVDHFDPLFITKVNQPLQMFDLFVEVAVPSEISQQSVLDGTSAIWSFSLDVYQTLRRALGERAKLINIQVHRSAAQPVTSAAPKLKPEFIMVQIVCDAIKASHPREFGPSYEQKQEAAKFRDFWGEVSELWQFPSGEIVESVDWTKFSPLGYFGICQAIIRYILKSRLNVEDHSLEFRGHEFSDIMALSPADKAPYDSARAAFSQFENDVRELEDLPLSVKQVAAIGPETRYTACHPPSADRSLPIDVILSFEASSKWPENIASIQRAKMALLLQIGRSLEEAKDTVKTQLGLEDAERETENLAFLDVTYESGLALRLRIHSDQEETLLTRQTKDQTLDRHVRAETAELLTSLRWRSAILPLHSQSITTYSTRFPALSWSIRLTKKWFNAHRLSNYFKEPLVELFVLQSFLQPYPFPIPSTSSTGFLRTLLMLASYDWRQDALIVDPSDSLSSTQRTEISTRLEAWRKIDANMNRTTLFVATPFDLTGVAYTQHIPKVVATRMTLLARSAAKAVRDKGVKLDPRTLFQSGLRDYDVVIHLSAKAVRGVSREDQGKRSSRFKNLSKTSAADGSPQPEAPATALLRRLTSLYSNTLLFFHGASDDMVIAALWNPQLHSRGFSAAMPSSFRPVSGDDALYEVNREAVLAEIARIGGSLIEKIDARGGT